MARHALLPLVAGYGTPHTLKLSFNHAPWFLRLNDVKHVSFNKLCSCHNSSSCRQGRSVTAYKI